MANRELKTKIKLRYDLLANWTAKNPELLAGEIAIVAIPSGVTEMQVDGSQPNPPQILFKVGPGKFNDLSYASAKAADVYGWAKAASKPTYTAAEVGLGNVLNVASYAKTETYSKEEVNDKITEIQNALEKDTNTQYQIVKDGDNGFKLQAKEINGEWADVEGSSFKVDFEAINAAIAKKLDSATFETFESGYNTTIGGINESLAKKLEASHIEGKADTTYVDNKLAEKVNLSDYNTKMDEIADDIREISGLVNADIKEINAKFDDYYTKVEVNTELGKKADQSYVDTELGKKVDSSSYTEDMGTINGKISGIEGDIDSLEGRMSTVEGKFDNYATNSYLTEQLALKANKAEVEEDILEINNKFDSYYTKEAADGLFMTEGEVDARINKIITDAVDGDTLTSLTELVQYINTHGGEAAKMAEAIEVLEGKLEGIDSTVAAYVTAAIEALKIGDYAKASDLADLAARVLVVEGKPAMGISSDNITNWNGIEGRVDEKLDKKVDLEGYVAYSQTEKDKLAGLENYDDSTVKGLISAEETRAKGVEEGLEGRISTLEGKPFDTYATKTEVEAVDTLVDGAIERIGNIEADYLKGEDKTTLSNAINTEKGRIDTLVTKTIPGINATIDTLATKTEVSEAITNSHKHDNKAILDATTESFTTALKTKYDGYESSINDFVNNTRGYATISQVKSVEKRVKAIEDDGTILRDSDVFIWDCGGAAE